MVLDNFLTIEVVEVEMLKYWMYLLIYVLDPISEEGQSTNNSKTFTSLNGSLYPFRSHVGHGFQCTETDFGNISYSNFYKNNEKKTFSSKHPRYLNSISCMSINENKKKIFSAIYNTQYINLSILMEQFSTLTCALLLLLMKHFRFN